MGRNNNDFSEGITPSKKDVDYATRYAYITQEEAKDLRPMDDSFPHSIYSRKQSDAEIHKNAGLNKIKGRY